MSRSSKVCHFCLNCMAAPITWEPIVHTQWHLVAIYERNHIFSQLQNPMQALQYSWKIGSPFCTILYTWFSYGHFLRIHSTNSIYKKNMEFHNGEWLSLMFRLTISHVWHVNLSFLGTSSPHILGVQFGVTASHDDVGIRSVSISYKASSHLISRSLEAARSVVYIIASLWNLTGDSAALLPRRLSNLTAIGQLYIQISWLRDFARSSNKTSYVILKRSSWLTSRDFTLHVTSVLRAISVLAPHPIQNILARWGCGLYDFFRCQSACQTSHKLSAYFVTGGRRGGLRKRRTPKSRLRGLNMYCVSHIICTQYCALFCIDCITLWRHDMDCFHMTGPLCGGSSDGL